MYYTLLRAFHAVASVGSVKGAAEALNVSQPTVSVQIKQLQETFNIELFYRRGRALVLSEAGEFLLTIAQPIFGHEDEALRYLNALRNFETGEFRIGSVTPYLVMSPAKHFQEEHRNVKVSVSVSPPREILNQLYNFELDAAFLGHLETDPRIQCVPYKSYPVVIMVNSQHRFASHDRIQIKNLQGEKIIMREQGSNSRAALERALTKSKTHIENVMEVNNREAIRDAVLLNMGIGAVSELAFVAHKDLKKIQVSDINISVRFYVACLRSRSERPLIKAFQDLTAQTAKVDAD